MSARPSPFRGALREIPTEVGCIGDTADRALVASRPEPLFGVSTLSGDDPLREALRNVPMLIAGSMIIMLAVMA